MSIDLVIKGGTTRKYPLKGDDDLHGEATAWAQDATTAINNAPSYSEIIQYDAVVGTAANVTAGIATHSDLSTAIAAVAAGDSIYILDVDLEPAAQVNINKAITIIGLGEHSVIEGDNIAAGAVVQISAVGVTLQNVKIIQGSGTPDYAIEIAAAMERINLNIKADGTFAIGLFLNGSVAGAVTGFISYDTNSVFFGGESQMVEQVKIEDQTTTGYNLVLQSDSDGSVLSADRIFTIDCNDGARTLDLSENLTIGDGYDVTITAEDVASSIVLDEQSLEIEGEGTGTRLFKLVNSTDSARTLTFAADVTATGSALTIAVEDAAGSITLDNCSLEVEDTIGSGNTIKFIIGTDDASRTVTLSENLVVADGFDVTLQAEDAASSIVLDEQSFEVEGEGTATKLFKLVNSSDSARTLSFAADVTATGYDLTIAVEDAAGAITLDNCSLEVEDAVGSGNTIKFVIATDDASRTVTLSENLTIGDGFDVTITAEDAASSITLDEQTFEVEGEGTATRLMKLINASDAPATLTIDGVSGSVDQDVTSGSTPTLAGVTNDSANLTFSTTTSGDINLDSVDNTIVLSSGAATNATTQTMKFGDDTGGITGVRNNSGSMEFQDLGGGWTAFASAVGATAALDNLAGVAINTSLISDTDSTDDLGSAAKAWLNGYFDNLHLEGGVNVLPTNHLPIAGDFPNTTNFYAWYNNGAGDYDDGDWVGSKALTENGALTSILTDASVNDVLGNDTFCYFDGTNDYLSSADAAFNMTGSFSACGWFYKADWTPAADNSLISRHDGANGWRLRLIASTKEIRFYNITGSAVEAVTKCGDLSPGWHHIVLVREDGTGTRIYIDGKCRACSNLHANITAAGDLEIGGANGGGDPFLGGIQHVAIDTDTAWTSNEVRKIYIAQSQRLVAEDALDNRVSIHDGRRNNGIIEVRPTAEYTITDSMAIVTGHQLIVPEDCEVKATFQGVAYFYDANATSATILTTIYDGTNDIEGAFRKFYVTGDADAERVQIPYNISITGYYLKDTVLSLRAQMDTGDNCAIVYTDGVAEPTCILEQLN